MPEIPEQFIAEARELLAAECERRELRQCAHHYRTGLGDDGMDVTVLARALYERVQEPPVDPKIEAMVKAVMLANETTADDWGAVALSRFEKILAEHGMEIRKVGE